MLFDHFAGKSTPLQKRLIEEWLKNPDNQELFYLWLFEWEHLSPQYIPTLDIKLAQFKKQITEIQDEPNSLQKTDFQTNKPTKSQSKWYRYAIASSVVLVLGVLSWLAKDLLYYKTYQTAYGQTQSIELQDGSKITLNANSSLRVPRFGFGQNSREVFLKGEALFSIKHTIDNQRFVVKTEKSFDVVVLGTEFTVFSRERGARVMLNKGKVQLRYQLDTQMKQVIMKPGDLILFDRQNHVKKDTAKLPEKFMAWQQHRLVFEDTPLSEFTEILAENYGINVVLANESLAKRTLVGTYQADNAEELLYTIVEIFDLKVSKAGNRYILSEN